MIYLTWTGDRRWLIKRLKSLGIHPRTRLYCCPLFRLSSLISPPENFRVMWSCVLCDDCVSNVVSVCGECLVTISISVAVSLSCFRKWLWKSKVSFCTLYLLENTDMICRKHHLLHVALWKEAIQKLSIRLPMWKTLENRWSMHTCIEIRESLEIEWVFPVSSIHNVLILWSTNEVEDEDTKKQVQDSKAMMTLSLPMSASAKGQHQGMLHDLNQYPSC